MDFNKLTNQEFYIVDTGQKFGINISGFVNVKTFNKIEKLFKDVKGIKKFKVSKDLKTVIELKI